jgi:hypothetical protein
MEKMIHKRKSFRAAAVWNSIIDLIDLPVNPV